MFKNLITGEIYLSRKEGKRAVGHAKFNRLLRLKQIAYFENINNSFANNYELLHQNTESRDSKAE